MRYADRADAGRRLAKALEPWADPHALVVALPRGGVVVGAEVARALGTPLAALPVRKLGAPGRAEYAVGALAGYETPVVWLEEGAARESGADAAYLESETDRQRRRLRDAALLYAPVEDRPCLAGRPLLLVDDGAATGATIFAALTFLSQAGARPVVLGLPVAPRETLRRLRPHVRAILCPWIPTPFYAVGDHYESFAPVSDEAVLECLRSVPALPNPSPA